MNAHSILPALRGAARLALAGCIVMLPAEVAGQAGAAPVPKSAPASAPISAAGKAESVLVGYDRSLRQQDFAGLDKPTVLRMQGQLEVIYRDLDAWQDDYAARGRPLNDGIVGPVTLMWLQRYAFNFKLGAAPGSSAGTAFPRHMTRLAAFAQAHPAELDILLSKGFEDWDSANAAATRAQDYAIRRRGDEAGLIELVNRYRASRVAAPNPAVADADGGDHFVLHGDDLTLLGGKVQIGAMLAKYKDKPFASKEALKAALSQDFKGHTRVLDTLWPIIARSVRPFDGYLFNAASRATLKKEGVAQATLDELAALGDVYLKSSAAFDAYVADRIAAGDLTMSDEAMTQLINATRVFDNYHLDQPALDSVQKQLLGSVQYGGVPPAIVKMLGQMQDVEYASGPIFHSAAQSKIAFGLGMCKMNAPFNNSYVAGLAISNDELAALQKDLEGLRPASGGSHASASAAPALAPQFQQIARLRELPQRCGDEDKAAADNIVKALYAGYLQAAVDTAGRKPMPDKIAPIHIGGADCGCALDDLDGVVVGFYPYWNTPEGKPGARPAAQAVNFRALNRMAYYGLSVDDTGELRLGSDLFKVDDGSADANEFVAIAHQYNSSVDWLIEKSDWGNWKALKTQGRKAVFDRMLHNIGDLLNAPLSGPGARLKRLASFGLSPQRRGDGVILYFPNYPDDPESTVQFNDFYRALRTEMSRHGLWLNLLVTQDTLASGKNGKGGAFGLHNLIGLRAERGAVGFAMDPDARDNHEYLMVLLNEPSADAKKTLRRDLENDAMLHGAVRADFLRSILPVLHFDNHNWQQLDDDIVYAHDNFGGVGLWAPNLGNMAQAIAPEGRSCLDAQQIVVCLLNDYHRGPLADNVAGPIERLACVHRWPLRWAMWCLVGTGIVLVALFFTSCKAQKFIKDNFLWVQMIVGLPILLIFILLLLYDPALLTLSHGNLPFTISAGVMMIGIVVGYRFWRAQRQVPQRERGLPQRQGMGFPIVVWTIGLDRQGFQWLIRNRGSGYAIIEKVEILLDGTPVADVKTALASVMGADRNALWKSVPLVGQKLEPGRELVGFSITDADAAQRFEQKRAEHDLAVKITYSGPNNEHWVSDGQGIVSAAGAMAG